MTMEMNMGVALEASQKEYYPTSQELIRKLCSFTTVFENWGTPIGNFKSFIKCCNNFNNPTFRMAQEGRITEVQVYGIQKRYNPEKHYVFILKIQRESRIVPDYIFRTYKEFCELDSKLCNAHPQARNHRYALFT